MNERIQRLQQVISNFNNHRRELEVIFNDYMTSTKGMHSPEKSKIIMDHKDNMIWISHETFELKRKLASLLT